MPRRVTAITSVTQIRSEGQGLRPLLPNPVLKTLAALSPGFHVIGLHPAQTALSPAVGAFIAGAPAPAPALGAGPGTRAALVRPLPVC